MAEIPSSESISTKQVRITQLAIKMPQAAFTTLAHHIDMDWMREAYRRTRKDGAVGIDGQTAEAYEEKLEENLQSLLNRAKSGSYWAPPVKRVYIPKGDGSQTRPIGIPTFEDKVLQRAVVMVLEPIYERDFLDCSYGYRPGRSAHQALEAIWTKTMGMGGGWILEVDIRKFFDTLDHTHVRAILNQRIKDGVLMRLIGKWLKAGVMESGSVSYPETGSPQGGVISPILANAYLHEVLDTWFERLVTPRLKGPAFLIRYADDAIMVFKQESDAHRVMEVLPKRFGRYGLTLHPEKTRLVPFQRPRKYPGPRSSERVQRPGTFDMLGLTHFWGKSRKGNWVVKRKTASDRLTRALRAVTQWCRKYRHLSIEEQQQALRLKVQGHYGYYGIVGNSRALSTFRHLVYRVWHKWLSRRSRRSALTWAQFGKLLERYALPAPRVRPVLLK